MKAIHSIALSLGILATTPFVMAPGVPGCGHCINADIVWVMARGHGSHIDILLENRCGVPADHFWTDLYVNLGQPPERGDPPDVITGPGRIDGYGTEMVTVYVEQSPVELAWIDIIVDASTVDSERVALASFEIWP